MAGNNHFSRKKLSGIAASLVGAPSHPPISMEELQHAEAFYELQRMLIAAAANKAYSEDKTGDVPNFYSAIKLIKASNEAAEVSDVDESTVKEFFDRLGDKKFIQVQTGHPTEVWGSEAVFAQRRLRKLVDNNIDRILAGNIDADILTGLKDRFEILKAEMKKPYWKINGDEDKVLPKKTSAIARQDSMIASERLYRSTEYTVINIYNAFRTNGIEITPERVMQELANRKFFETRTWKPGDNDGDPSFTLKELISGSKGQLEAINRRYILDVAEMAAMLPDGEAKKILRRVISCLIETIESKSEKAQGKIRDYALRLENGESGAGKNSGVSIAPNPNRIKAAQEILYVLNKRETPETKITLGRTREYSDGKDFLNDIDYLKNLTPISSLTKNVNGVEISRVELLKLNASIFGERALRAEYRQNTAVFRIAFAEVSKLFGYKNVEPEQLLLTIRNNSQLATKAKKIIDRYIEDNQEKFDNLLKDYVEKSKDIPIGYRKFFYTFDLLTKLKAIAADPEGYPTVLEAECHGFRDIMMGQFMLELMHRGEGLPKNNVAGLYESMQGLDQIIPTVNKLVKYQDDITVMVAGSDLLKSAGVGGKAYTKKIFNILEGIEKGAFELPEGKKITVYLGNGSAMHRNSVVLEFYRTTQGIEMRLNGPVDVATEFQMVASRYITDKKRRESDRADDRRKSKFTEALMNLSNTLNVSTSEQRDNSEKQRERMLDFQEKYGSQMFGSLVDTFPNTEGDGPVNNAPRPAFRPSYVILDDQVGKMVELLFSNFQALESKQLACWMVNQKLGTKLTVESIINSEQIKYEIVGALEQKYPDSADRMKEFLQEIGKMEIPKDNPLSKITLEMLDTAQEKGPEKMRAIGFGSNLYITAWGPIQAYFDISEFVEEYAKDGKINDPKQAVKEYLQSPYNVGDSINRSLYTQAIYEPDTGLRFLEARFCDKFSILPSYENGKLVFEIKSDEKLIRIDAEDFFMEEDTAKHSPYHLASFFTKVYPSQNPSQVYTPQAREAYQATMGSMVLYWESVKANRTMNSLLTEIALQGNFIEPQQAVQQNKIQNPASQDLRDLISKISPDALGHELSERAEILKFHRAGALELFSGFVKDTQGMDQKTDDYKKKLELFQKDETLNSHLREIKRIAESPIDVAKFAHYFARNSSELAFSV